MVQIYKWLRIHQTERLSKYCELWVYTSKNAYGAKLRHMAITLSQTKKLLRKIPELKYF
jgi:hypothetical protein